MREIIARDRTRLEATSIAILRPPPSPNTAVTSCLLSAIVKERSTWTSLRSSVAFYAAPVISRVPRARESASPTLLYSSFSRFLSRSTLRVCERGSMCARNSRICAPKTLESRARVYVTIYAYANARVCVSIGSVVSSRRIPRPVVVTLFNVA